MHAANLFKPCAIREYVLFPEETEIRQFAMVSDLSSGTKLEALLLMAHRSNVIPVAKSFDTSDFPETVMDPVCGKELERKTSKYVSIRGETAYYFCSKECQSKFSSHALRRVK